MSETQICTEFNYRLHTLNLRVLDTEFKYALEEEVLLFVFPSYLLNSHKHATVKIMVNNDRGR
jgi:hypothetical protein